MPLTRSPENVPWELLAAYLAGELALEEQDRVREWLAEDEGHDELLTLLRQGWEANGVARRRYDAEAALQWIKRQPMPEITPIRRFRLHDNGASRWRHAGARRAWQAASIAMLVAGGWWVASRTANRTMPSDVAEIGAFTEYRTAGGQRLTIKLSDGSSVTLAPASTLRIGTAYANARAGAPRAVTLEGEAYFEVVHSAARPFSVRAANTLVRDLGTRFVVRAYPEDRKTGVLVTEGLAAIGRAGAGRAGRTFASDSLLVRPGQGAQMMENGDLVISPHIDIDEAIGWTEGRLVFRDTPLPEALRRISRWYGVPVRLADSALAGRTLNAVFRDEPIAEVVRLVAVPFGVRAERDGHGFMLRSGASSH